MTGLDRRPVRRVQRRAGEELPTGWPYDLPPVRQLLRDGLDLPEGVTFLVGENGSGKSTLVEALAMAYGLNAEGGSRGAQLSTRRSESDLSDHLQLVRGIDAPRWSFFLRAETMHGLYTYLEANPGKRDPAFHEMSHGEGFFEVLLTRFDSAGFYVLDEPESALSFSSSLALVGVLAELVEKGSQVVCATHSPLLCALPGATILELDDQGYHEAAWEELEIVDHWRRYLGDPGAYLRHILPNERSGR
ncbi:putative ATPase [Motilibacter rhizosphaerae]|uniref:Putative ATPase n=1 Tax=Motilibacter rhizosphaerae TaxID=598652 RepID=A0A4Q7NPV9_9ACTN|nr:AAA family ATPase [Motilibacter rhizosphaerae]RZS87132.1 putative ATPase [Motilibacter rhizosphaerae]